MPGARSALAVVAVVAVTLGACTGDDPAVTSFTATVGETTSTTASTSGSTAAESTSTSTTSDASGDPSTTTSTGVAERCGDGILQDDEECDDGPANDDAATCTESCAVNVCGDGLVLEGVEECDDGDANADNSPCTSTCAVNVCGDGLILENVEECDDGAANADSAPCTSACRLNVCGDGLVLDGVEECDDGVEFAGSGDGCSATCTREQVFFVSLDTYSGAIGGAKGADALCLEAGTKSVALPWPELNNTTFRAWIADPNCPLDKRLPQEERPYVRVDGKLIAENWAELIGGALESGAMQMNEYGLIVEEIWSFRVWTGIAGDGSMIDGAAAKTCNFWTLEGDSFFGALGMANAGGSTWTRATDGEGDLVQGCQEQAHLYCVQISCDVHPEFCEPGYCAP